MQVPWLTHVNATNGYATNGYATNGYATNSILYAYKRLGTDARPLNANATNAVPASPIGTLDNAHSRALQS